MFRVFGYSGQANIPAPHDTDQVTKKFFNAAGPCRADRNYMIPATRRLAEEAVIGLRDVCDYKVLSGGSPHLGTPSPFNIAVRSLTIRDFTAAEVRELLMQYTAETGQVFTEETLQLVFDLTQGQPWLVNALAKV